MKNKASWKEYDATCLVEQTQLDSTILVEQGTEDTFYQQKQLLPEKFQDAATKSGQKLNLRWQTGYDHSYFTISSFIKDHMHHHAAYLNQ